MPDKVMLPHINDMTFRYQTAQKNLIDIIAKQEYKGNVTAYRKSVLANVNAELDSLNKYVGTWTNAYLPLSYENGADSAYAYFRRNNVPVGVVALNQAVIEDIVFQAREQYVAANAYIGRRIADEFREVGMDVIANKVATGSMVKEAQKEMVKRFADKGVSTITYRNGRVVQMDVYARLVAITTTSEATNKGSMNAVQALGYDLVRMSQNLTTCPICAVYEGRIYSISGNHPDYPALDEAFYRGYNTIHPNCNHRIFPYIPELDDDVLQNRIQSNRPFTIDEDKKAGIARYNEQQQANIKRARDRNLWLKAKTAAPEQTPSTLSAFRSMKRANSEKYQKLQAAVQESINRPATLKGGLSLVDPRNIIPINPVTNTEKFKALVVDMQDNGWKGRPILAVDDGDTIRGLTGSHRVYAAREAGIDVETSIIDAKNITPKQQEIIDDAFRADDAYRADELAKLKKSGVVSEDQIQLMRKESEINTKEEAKDYSQKARIYDQRKAAEAKAKKEAEEAKKKEESEKAKKIANSKEIQEYNDYKAMLQSKYKDIWSEATDAELDKLEKLERAAYKK